MMPDARSVVIVTGTTDAESLGGLMAASDVWLADNPVNTAAADELMSSGTHERVSGCLTTFELSDDPDVENIAQVFDLVCDHYNEYAPRGDWSSIRIITDKDRRAICETLSSWQGTFSRLVQDGVLVSKT